MKHIFINYGIEIVVGMIISVLVFIFLRVLHFGYLKKESLGKAAGGSDAIAAYESAPPDKYALPGGFSKPPHQPHIENFLAAIRDEAKLTCDAKHALESEAPIYWVNPAAKSRQTIQFTEEHLHV